MYYLLLVLVVLAGCGTKTVRTGHVHTHVVEVRQTANLVTGLTDTLTTTTDTDTDNDEQTTKTYQGPTAEDIQATVTAAVKAAMTVGAPVLTAAVPGGGWLAQNGADAALALITGLTGAFAVKKQIDHGKATRALKEVVEGVEAAKADLPKDEHTKLIARMRQEQSRDTQATVDSLTP